MLRCTWLGLGLGLGLGLRFGFGNRVRVRVRCTLPLSRATHDPRSCRFPWPSPSATIISHVAPTSSGAMSTWVAG